MSYRVDIPTLSTNEVYTLTFEYEGTETIQLIVGDLTLETTDRRVVFTTNSPVNYIESNVNLINLNMYEGYYESDDFGGEYIQESYIEGKTEIIDNVMQCVKSPKILSQTKHQNLVITDIFKLSSDSSSGATFDKETQTVTVTNGGRYASAIFWFQPQRWGYADYSRMCVEFDVVEIGKLKDGENPYFSLGQNCSALAGYSSTTFLYEGDHVKVAFSTSSLLDVRSSLIAFNTNGSTGGINNKLVITNFTMYYIVYLDDVGTYDCCKLTTPDDLELYSLSDVQDTLDLTNGLVTRKIGKLTNCHELISGHSYDENGGFYTARLRWLHVQNINTKGNNTLALCNVLSNGSYKPNTIWSHGVDGAYYLHFGGCATLEEAQQYCLDNNLTILYELKEPITEQLPTPLNPLKSYRNGSITTSSQQLTPTLTTTLPISNKFTTTNLTSGSTYNVYFDGTATKLDAGGTIITNPVSPCEVECGGTTLTIDGTDIQNVRVIETTVKNEIGSVCGTTDVELSKIKTKCGIHNIFDDYFQGSHSTSWAKDYNCTSTRDDTTVKIVGKGSLNYAGYSLVESLPFGTYKLHYKVKVSTIGDKYMVALSQNPNGTPQDAYVPVTDVTSTALVEEQTFVFYKKHITHMLFYTYTNGQEIEYYDISLIKLSDEDITGTDTSSINYSQVTSDLEQPIKLRSLGTTYDSYNLVTGELVKRIGVSETDGSYSVLSSPIVMETRKTEVNGYMADKNTICKEYSKGYEFNTSGQLSAIDIGHYTDYYIKIPENTKTLSFKGMSYYKRIMIYDENKNFIKCFYTYDNYNDATGNITSDMKYVRLTTVKQNSQGRGYGDMRSYLVTDTNYLVFTSDTSLQTLTIPHLYTNGQVKVYSDSEVYPTTILNGQSTNNYEVNELNKSNNYTIRYDGTCESINLAKKSNTQGTNRIVKAGATSGNLTFVNDSGDIDNVLLVQNDVREQEINHFTGLQTVEISRMLIENQKNMWWNDWITPSQYGASWQVDSPEFISVQPGETIYVVANNNSYTSLLEFDENYNIVNQGKDLILSNEANPKPVNLGNNYYKNYRVLSENTRYIKFIIPASTASTAKNETRWSVISFTKADIGNVPLYTNNTPYRGSIINLPQPVQLNSLLDGTHDTYNPITGEYVQNVGTIQWDSSIVKWNKTYSFASLIGYSKLSHVEDWGNPNYKTLVNEYSMPSTLTAQNSISNNATMSREFNGGWSYWGAVDFGVGKLAIIIPREFPGGINEALQYLDENPIMVNYKRTEPITTQLTPIEIPTFEGGILQFITTDGKVFPMVEYSMPTNNRYDTSSWETGAVYTQRNMTEAYFNDSTTPMTPTETMTLTTDHISSGSIILNDNGNGLIVLKGNYTGRDIPYFTGMRSVEAIEIEVSSFGSPDGALFGKGGRK